ncbi:MAG: hydantoinase/oxoprolinase N-terminal domain-containing protein, partial [Candidatus Baltobacteraceae bacterium]
MAKLRLGIDVGGTFTDVVAIDAATRELVARVKVPTTHDAAEGVAAGIVLGIERVLREHDINPDDVAFIAHSTTQATNSLLEGDVARVGVVGLLDGFAPLSRRQMHFAPFELGANAPFAPDFRFVATRESADMRAAIDQLRAGGAQAIAVSHAFSVDRREHEEAAVAYAREQGMYATAGH